MGSIYSGKRVLVTGHTGFKGSWLAHWLCELGAQVHGFALAEPGAPAAFTGLGVRARLASDTRSDLRDLTAVRQAFERANPDFVFHLAAQALVRTSYDLPLETIQTNFIGTAHLLEALRVRQRPCAVVLATSDKCYENRELGRAFIESDPMGGEDIYSMSKGACELLAASYRASFFPPELLPRHGVALATVRAGNVIGGGDYAVDRVIPDCVRALRGRRAVPVRNPLSTRPWQHVFESLSGYLTLGAALAGPKAASFCKGWNFGPGPTAPVVDVETVVSQFIKAWGEGSLEKSPDSNAPREARTLQLSTELAVRELGWHPAWPVETAIACTAEWYREFETKDRTEGSMLEFARRQLARYATDARSAGSSATEIFPATGASPTEKSQ